MASTRDEKIRKMYLENPTEWNYKALARKFHMSGERVRQIISREADQKLLEFELLKNNYLVLVGRMSEMNLRHELAMHTKYSRTKESVYKRMVCVYYLKEKFGYSFSEIARQVKRDHTSISNLYQKFSKELTK